MEYDDGNDVIIQFVFKSHEKLVEKWEFFKVISIICDYEVASIIYEIKVVS